MKNTNWMNYWMYHHIKYTSMGNANIPLQIIATTQCAYDLIRSLKHACHCLPTSLLFVHFIIISYVFNCFDNIHLLECCTCEFFIYGFFFYYVVLSTVWRWWCVFECFCVNFWWRNSLIALNWNILICINIGIE